jgi:flagellar hook-length control protein FliK
MIAATPAPKPSNGNAASAPPSSPNASPASPFDAILTLEGLAATCAALDNSSLADGVLEGLDETTGADSDDDSDTEDGGPLAFLVNLLNFAAPAADPADADGSIDGVTGGHKHAAAAAAEQGAVLQAAANADDGGSAADAAGKLLLADISAASLKTDAASKDAQSAQDQAVNMARAAEMLSQGARHAAGAARDNIATPVHSPRWADDLGARVALMVRGAESSASLQLTPVDLGPVEVNVTVRDSQASIHFGAAQAETRALLEASIPRLREMLAAQGFNLMDASVSQGFARQTPPSAPLTPGANGPEAEAETAVATRVTALGLLDTYA